MKTAKREDGSNSVDKISELPEGILQGIFSLLSQEEAVRTSVLSKSWRNIWCTRPNLDLSDVTFKGNKHQFLSVVNTALELYYDQRMCVDEFRLCVSVGHSDHEFVYLLEKWVRTLTNMSVKKFCLRNSSKDRNGLVELPPVVLGAESLQHLHVENFMLNRNAIRRLVIFKHLRSLRLDGVLINDDIFKKIISRCPLVENICVDECIGLGKIEFNNLRNLKNFYFSDMDDEHICSIEIHAPYSLETIHILEGDIWFHKGAEFRNLNSLNLIGVKSSFDHLPSCKFPVLEKLEIRDCDGLKEIQLFIDAPKIRSFDYYGEFVPSIYIATTSSKWGSDINLWFRHSSDASSLWFLKLKELLKSLSQSEISLTFRSIYMNIDMAHVFPENNQGQEIDGGNTTAVVVESLAFGCPLSSNSSLLNCALSICRPRNIKYSCLCLDKGERERIECLWKINSNADDQFRKLWKRDLEQASLEIKKKTGGEEEKEEWRTITLSELQNYDVDSKKECHHVSLSELPWYHQEIDKKGCHHMSLSNDQETERIFTRFALKWRQDEN
ncbi:hypothetical protein ABFS83_05G052300 [Erythranthe nasuta]